MLFFEEVETVKNYSITQEPEAVTKTLHLDNF